MNNQKCNTPCKYGYALCKDCLEKHGQKVDREQKRKLLDIPNRKNCFQCGIDITLRPSHLCESCTAINDDILADNINHPKHYTQGGIECIDAINDAVVNKTGLEAVCVANVIKYLWRYELKNGLEDIKKAQWYLNKLIDVKEKEELK